MKTSPWLRIGEYILQTSVSLPFGEGEGFPPNNAGRQWRLSQRVEIAAKVKRVVLGDF